MIPYSRPKFSGDGSRAYISTALPGGPDYCYLYAIDVQPSSSAVGGESAPTLPLWATAAPNPFGESTTIRYRREVNQQLRARIFDADGRLIRSLRLAADTGAGSVTWDGCDEAGRTVGGGLYFARLQSRDRSIVLKMVRTP